MGKDRAKQGKLKRQAQTVDGLVMCQFCFLDSVGSCEYILSNIEMLYVLMMQKVQDACCLGAMFFFSIKNINNPQNVCKKNIPKRYAKGIFSLLTAALPSRKVCRKEFHVHKKFISTKVTRRFRLLRTFSSYLKTTSSVFLLAVVPILNSCIFLAPSTFLAISCLSFSQQMGSFYHLSPLLNFVRCFNVASIKNVGSIIFLQSALGTHLPSVPLKPIFYTTSAKKIYISLTFYFFSSWQQR